MATPGYTVNNLMAGAQQNVAVTPGITILRLNAPAATSKRFFIWELDLGQSGPPNATDASVQWWLAQCSATAAATGGELYFPQTISTGPGLRCYSATYASTALARMNFTEI